MSRRRPFIFTAVGIIGYVVQSVALWLLAGRGHLPIVPATLLATELAVLHNFAWHVRWTWADRPAGARATLGRLLRFNVANGGVSLIGGALLMPLLVHSLGVHYLLANLITVLICAVVNYLAGDRWVFSPAPSIGSTATHGTTPSDEQATARRRRAVPRLAVAGHRSPARRRVAGYHPAQDGCRSGLGGGRRRCRSATGAGSG